MRPPTLAAWLLERFGPDNEPLVGDLRQEFCQARRGRLWYWRQALHAIVAGFVRDAAAHTFVCVRALLLGWCLLWMVGPGGNVVGPLALNGWFPQWGFSAKFLRIRLYNEVVTVVPVNWTYYEWPIPRVVDMLLVVLSCLILAGGGWIIARFHPRVRGLSLATYLVSLGLCFLVLVALLIQTAESGRYGSFAVQMTGFAVRYALYAVSILMGGLLVRPRHRYRPAIP